MRRYLLTSCFIGMLYLLNRYCLIPLTAGSLHDLLVWHGADILAGALILCILDAVLIVFGRRPLRVFWKATLFLLVCGVFWEGITPLYLHRSVGDFKDLIAYWVGGSSYWFLENRVYRKRES